MATGPTGHGRAGRHTRRYLHDIFRPAERRQWNPGRKSGTPGRMSGKLVRSTFPSLLSFRHSSVLLNIQMTFLFSAELKLLFCLGKPTGYFWPRQCTAIKGVSVILRSPFVPKIELSADPREEHFELSFPLGAGSIFGQVEIYFSLPYTCML